MGDHMEVVDTEDTISLSGFLFEDNNISPQEVSGSSSSSSSSRSSFEHEFSGFFSEEWKVNPSYITSPENIIFCGKVLSSKPSVSRVPNPDTSSRASALFRSSSDSFKFIKTASRQSTPRSKSLPNGPNRILSSSSCKPKWQVFIFGFGSGNFSTTMDMSDIKSRQLRRQSTVKVDVDGGRKSGKKSWWRLVDVLGCNGGYERDTMVVI